MVHVRERATTHHDRQTFWLMLLTLDGASHYITVLNPEGFFSHGKRASSCRKHTCPLCWHQFSSAKDHATHLQNGCLIHGGALTDVVPSEDKGIQFSDWDNKKKTLQHTKYYADFETCTNLVSEPLPNSWGGFESGESGFESRRWRCSTVSRFWVQSANCRVSHWSGWPLKVRVASVSLDLSGR
jgi:hypothetical protein